MNIELRLLNQHGNLSIDLKSVTDPRISRILSFTVLKAHVVHYGSIV